MKKFSKKIKKKIFFGIFEISGNSFLYSLCIILFPISTHIFKKLYINLFCITLLDIRFFLKIFSASFPSIVSPLIIISLDDRDRIVIAFLLANKRVIMMFN